jgi:hypothetical protein
MPVHCNWEIAHLHANRMRPPRLIEDQHLLPDMAITIELDKGEK